jgi:uncharacterized protein (TIGR03086 family)
VKLPAPKDGDATDAARSGMLGQAGREEGDMSGLVDVWREVAAKWNEVYASVGDDRWDLDTPCDAWNVRDLVDHTLRWQAAGGALLGAPTAAGDDWPTIRAAYEAHLSNPANLQGTVDEFGGWPKHDLAAFMIGDLLIHSWDLAHSIGADETLPQMPVEVVMAGLQHAPAELLRGENPLGQPMMGPPVEVPDEAALQDRMLAFTGRRSLP